MIKTASIGGRAVGEDSNRQTHTTGEVYVHPRGKGYRDNYDEIFNKEEAPDEDPVEGTV